MFPYNTVLLKLTLASDGSPVLVGEATFPYNTVLLKLSITSGGFEYNVALFPYNTVLLKPIYILAVGHNAIVSSIQCFHTILFFLNLKCFTECFGSWANVFNNFINRSFPYNTVLLKPTKNCLKIYRKNKQFPYNTVLLKLCID